MIGIIIEVNDDNSGQPLPTRNNPEEEKSVYDYAMFGCWLMAAAKSLVVISSDFDHSLQPDLSVMLHMSRGP